MEHLVFCSQVCPEMKTPEAAAQQILPFWFKTCWSTDLNFQWWINLMLWVGQQMGQYRDEGGCNKFLEMKLVQHWQHMTTIIGHRRNSHT